MCVSSVEFADFVVLVLQVDHGAEAVSGLNDLNECKTQWFKSKLIILAKTLS